MPTPIHSDPYVIIPNWNGIDFLPASLDSIGAQSLKCQIVVVDNGSSDGSLEMMRSRYPQVHIIELDRNYGFAGGVNQGLQYAIEQGAQYAALFNNDAKADRDWLKSIVEAADAHPEAGIITCKLRHLKGNKLDSTGDFYSTWGFAFPRGRDKLDQGQYDEGEYVFSGSGGASLYRTDMLRAIGLFDEVFFAYFEDVDISFRAQMAGWKVWYEPRAVAYHHIGGTSSKHSNFARYHTLKNFPLLYTKNMPGILYWKYLPRALLAYTLMLLRDISRGMIGTVIRGLIAAHWHLLGALWKRRQIQNNRRVSIEYINGILYHGMPPTQQGLLRLGRLFDRGSK